TRLVAARSNLMPYAEQLHIKLTYLPFVIKAVAIALQKHPIFNSTVNDEAMTITYRKDIHIGVAMAIEEGLVVPVINNANKKSIMQIDQEVSELSNKAHEQKLSPQELRGSTFTISSTGAKGGWYATPIINYPEVAILGVHKIKQQAIVVDNQIEIGHMMGMSITFDPLIKKDYPPTLDKYAYKCGFLEHVRRTIEPHKQTEQSVYVVFCLLKTFIKVFLSNMQQITLSCRDLVRKEIKEQNSLPFMARKGVRNHEAIFFSDYHRKSI